MAELVERARELGWSGQQIRVIDAELGMSGAAAVDRGGFQELVAEVVSDDQDQRLRCLALGRVPQTGTRSGSNSIIPTIDLHLQRFVRLGKLDV